MKASVIITAHNEGEVLHATIRSVQRALRQVKEEVEIILHLDSATEETQRAAEEYHNTREVKVLENSFGDVGPARNFAAAVAKGEFLFFVDGDDLVSQGYFAEMLKILEENPEAVVSPEIMAEFDLRQRRGAILRMESSGTKAEQAFLLFSINCWTVAIAGRRQIFLEHRYIESKNGYGHEDYALNIELAAAGIPHLVAPRAIYFYRRKQVSREKWNNAEHHTQPWSELFAPKFWCDMQISEQPKNMGLREVYMKMRNNRFLKNAMEPAGRMAKKILACKSEKLPTELLTVWQEVAKIEPEAAPEKLKINTLGLRGVSRYCPASEVYLEICKAVDGELEQITWDILEKYARRLTDDQAEMLVTRTMVQTGGKIIVSSSNYGKKWLEQHKKLVETLGVKQN